MRLMQFDLQLAAPGSAGHCTNMRQRLGSPLYDQASRQIVPARCSLFFLFASMIVDNGAQCRQRTQVYTWQCKTLH